MTEEVRLLARLELVDGGLRELTRWCSENVDETVGAFDDDGVFEPDDTLWSKMEKAAAQLQTELMRRFMDASRLIESPDEFNDDALDQANAVITEAEDLLIEWRLVLEGDRAPMIRGASHREHRARVWSDPSRPQLIERSRRHVVTRRTRSRSMRSRRRQTRRYALRRRGPPADPSRPRRPSFFGAPA